MGLVTELSRHMFGSAEALYKVKNADFALKEIELRDLASQIDTVKSKTFKKIEKGFESTLTEMTRFSLYLKNTCDLLDKLSESCAGQEKISLLSLVQEQTTQILADKEAVEKMNSRMSKILSTYKQKVESRQDEEWINLEEHSSSSSCSSSSSSASLIASSSFSASFTETGSESSSSSSSSSASDPLIPALPSTPSESSTVIDSPQNSQRDKLLDTSEKVTDASHAPKSPLKGTLSVETPQTLPRVHQGRFSWLMNCCSSRPN